MCSQTMYHYYYWSDRCMIRKNVRSLWEFTANWRCLVIWSILRAGATVDTMRWGSVILNYISPEQDVIKQMWNNVLTGETKMLACSVLNCVKMKTYNIIQINMLVLIWLSCMKFETFLIVWIVICNRTLKFHYCSAWWKLSWNIEVNHSLRRIIWFQMHLCSCRMLARWNLIFFRCRVAKNATKCSAVTIK